MASIDRYSNQWRARWRTPDGHQRSKVFRRKLDAQRHLTNVEHQKATGGYVDPSAGKVTFQSYAEEWVTRQVWRPSTTDAIAAALARVFPVNR